MTTRSLSASGLALLKKAEALPGGKPALKPYRDAGGWSIGYGHFIKPEESGVGGLMSGIDEAKADALLVFDAAWATKAVNRYVTAPITKNQFDALVDFVYNEGETAFRKSTLLRLLNAGDLAAAAAEFPKWKYAQGKVSDALVARRAAERALFQTA